MNSIALLAGSLALCTAACGRPPIQPRTDIGAWVSSDSERRGVGAPIDVAESPTANNYKIAPRMPGDFVVYRFSGSFRKEPVVLTQRVVARDGAGIVMDATLEEGATKQTLRLWMSDAGATRGEITAVARVDGDRETPAGMAAYDAMMSKTTLTADANEALIAEEDMTLEVGKTTLPCRQTIYRVRIGKKEATMKTISSDRFVWGDVGAEIATTDGKVLYRAQVVETGSQPVVVPSAAVAELSDD